MAGSRLACAVDTSIWIDLREGGLIATAFRLPFEWLIPDVVFAELSEADAQALELHGVQVRELPPEQVLEVQRLAALYRRLSAVDLFTLVLAQSLSLILLTGDGPLRKAAEAEGAEVHGVLWLLDQLVESRLLSPQEAVAALIRMVEGGSRLPIDAVEERLMCWGRGDSASGDEGV
jgi:predicted nucleic acid-binding protein